jgi:hypothetical protein
MSPAIDHEKGSIGPGCKWPLDRLITHFQLNQYSFNSLWRTIQQMVITTLLPVSQLVPKVNNCFELYGFGKKKIIQIS